MALLLFAGAHKSEGIPAGVGLTWVAINYGDGYNSGYYSFALNASGQDAEVDLWLPTGVVLSHQYTYIRHKFRLDDLLDAGQTTTNIAKLLGVSVPLDWYVKDVSGNNRLYLEASDQVGTGGTNLAINTNYVIEIEWNNAAGGVGTCTLKLDGVAEISLTGCATVNLATAAVAAVRCGAQQAKGENRGLQFRIWDFALGDGSGSKNNSWLSAFEVGFAALDGDHGAPAQDFTDAGAATADYQDWDDPQTGHDSDTTYAQSATSGDQEQLSTLETGPTAGIDATNYHLEAVRVRAPWKDSGVGAVGNRGLLVQQGGTDYETPTTYSVTAYDGETVFVSGQLVKCYESLPGGGDWTNAAFASLEVGGYRKTAAPAINFRCTAMVVTLARLAGAEAGAGAYPYAYAVML